MSHCTKCGWNFTHPTKYHSASCKDGFDICTVAPEHHFSVALKAYAATSSKKEDEKQTETETPAAPAAPTTPTAPAEKSITKSELLSHLQAYRTVAESDEVVAAIQDITDNLAEHLN